MNLTPNAQALAWTLIHFVWQGVLLWVGVALGFYLTRHRSAQFRYVLGCLGLVLALLLPMATFSVLKSGALPAFESLRVEALPRSLMPSGQGISSGPWLGLRGYLLPFLPWALGCWGLGAVLLALRLAGGWLWMQRLRLDLQPIEAAWASRIHALAIQVGLHRPFRMGLSHRVRSPQVLGWIHPLLLIPVGLLSGLDPAAAEALLVHELAHIRRHDYFVNLLQCAVEVLLFYHPAVWWISRRVRAEREACCDDMAMQFCGDALAYAETLNQLDDLHARISSPAQGADGGTLMERINRLLLPPPTAPRRAWLIPVLALSLVATAGLMAQAPEKPQAAKSHETAEAPKKAEREAASTKSKAKSEADRSAASTEKVYATPARREIKFHVFKRKEGLQVSFEATRATRGEILKALERIEILAAGAQEGSGPTGGTWPLKPIKDGAVSEDELLSFSLSNVTLEGIRKTL